MKPRAEAIAKGLKWYFTGKPCRKGHIAKRQVSSKSCWECHQLAYAKWESANLEARSARKRIGIVANPDKIRADHRKSWHLNRVTNLVRAKDYYKRNKANFIAYNRAKRAALLQRIPSWADMDACRIFYVIAARATQCTGIQFHVDHVVPLQGRLVSGLHVPNNLQVLSKTENKRKYNKWQP